jgi:hypothetical protein
MALGSFIVVGITEKPQIIIFSKDAFLETPIFGTMTDWHMH